MITGYRIYGEPSLLLLQLYPLRLLDQGLLKTFTRDKDEENAECGIEEQRPGEDNKGPSCKELANIRLPYAREVEWSVLAESNEGKDGVQRVLVRGKAVNTNSKGENELELVSMDVLGSKKL